MNSSQFITEIEEEYGDFVDSTKKNIMEWIKDGKIGDAGLQLLYRHIIKNHKYKSIKLAHINDYWLEIKGNVKCNNLTPFSDEWILDKYKHLSVKEIYNKCVNIRAKDRKSLSTEDISFLHAWDDIWHVWNKLEEANWMELDIVDYCKKVRDSIEKGEKVGVVRVEEKPIPRFEETVQFKELNIF